MTWFVLYDIGDNLPLGYRQCGWFSNEEIAKLFTRQDVHKIFVNCHGYSRDKMNNWHKNLY